MQRLAKGFVMLSYDDNALVWKDRPLERSLFRTLEAQLDVEWMSTSRQGMYAFTASGRMIGHEVLREGYDDAMTRSEPVEAMLEGALGAYRALDTEERRTPSAEARALIEGAGDRVTPHDDARRDAALILRVTGRDLPRDGTFERHLWSAGGRWEPRSAFNIDHAWFRAAEARGFVPEELVPGATRAVEPDLVARFARFHFLNNVRCHTAIAHRRGDVTEASLEARVVAVEGDSVTVTFSGRVAAAHAARTDWEKEWHGTDPIGFEGRLMGKGRWDRREERFTALRLLALGERFGSDATRPGEPRTPIGFAASLVGDDPRNLAAPRAIQNGSPADYWGPPD